MIVEHSFSVFSIMLKIFDKLDKPSLKSSTFLEYDNTSKTIDKFSTRSFESAMWKNMVSSFWSKSLFIISLNVSFTIFSFVSSSPKENNSICFFVNLSICNILAK